MKYILLFLIATTASAAKEPSEGELFLKNQPQELIDTLKKEKLAIQKNVESDEKTTQSLIKAVVLFDQSADTAIRMLIQTSKQADYLPVLQKSVTLKQFSDGNVDEHQLKVLLVSITYHVQHTWDLEAHKLSWTLDKSYENDLKTVDGGWTIYPIDDKHSVGEYHTHIDIGKAIPNFIQEFLTRRDLPKALDAQRLWVNSGGTYKKQ